MVSGFLNKFFQNKIVVFATKYFIYLLLGLSVFWGTFLFIFSFLDFFRTFKLTPNFFQAAFGFIGLIAWLNAWHYYKRIKKFGVAYLWQQFYQKEKKKVHLTIALGVIYFLAFQAFFKGVRFPEPVSATLYFMSLPLSFGDSVIFIVDVNLRRYLPALTMVNKLGWILGLTFEVIMFYYLSRIIYWRPKKKVKKKVKP